MLILKSFKLIIFLFSFKLTEITEMSSIQRHEALSYLMLWDCIINACAKSPVALRSVYTAWLHENNYEEVFQNTGTFNLLMLLKFVYLFFFVSYFL